MLITTDEMYPNKQFKLKHTSKISKGIDNEAL